MSNIELQMSVPAFLTAQRNALRYLGVCPPALPALGGVQFVIDRIEFGNNALRHDQATEFAVFFEDFGEKVPTKNPCTGFQTQLAQNVTIYLTTQGEILAHPNQPPSVLVPITVTVVFNLDLYALDDDCYLMATLAAVELQPPAFLPPIFSPYTTLPQAIQDQITQFLTQQARPFFPMTAVPLGLGKYAKAAKFFNAGISVDSQMQMVALRFQMGGANQNADVPWSNFFHGFFSDRLQGSDWAFFVEAGLLTETLKALVYENVPKDDNLEVYPGCTYSNAGGQAVFNLDALLIYHLYRNYDIDIDLSVEADPKVAIELSVEQPNVLTINFDFTHLLDSNDPLINLALDLAHLVGLPIETILYQLVGSAAVAQLSKTPLEDCKQTSPGHVRCDTFVRVPLVPGALQTTLTSLLALDDGVALAGSMNIRELTQPVLQTSLQEFKVEVPSISCGIVSMALVAAFQNDPSGFAILHARAFIENLGTAPLKLCNPPTVLKGAEANGPFPQNDISTDGQQAAFEVLVDIAAPSQDYYNAPYPLDLLLKTSAGTRLLRFNPPPFVRADQYQQMAAELLAKLGNCEQLLDPWFKNHQGYNPAWSPRPPEDGAVQHLWQVMITGLARGEQVALVNAQNQQLMTAIGTGSTIRLSALVAPGGEKELTILHLSEPALAPIPGAEFANLAIEAQTSQPATTRAGLEIRQTNLNQLGVIPLPERAQKLLVTNLFNGPCLVAVLEEGLMAFNFTIPDRPVLCRSWPVEGVRGALNWQGALLVFGQEGVEWIDGTGQRRVISKSCEMGLVEEAAANHQALFILTEEKLDIYSRKLCRIGSVPLEGGRSITRIGQRLVVGGQKGLTILEISNFHHPKGERFVEETSVRAVKPILAGEPGAFVVVPEDGMARLFSFNRSRAEEIARYNGSPWFLDTVRLEDLLIKIGANQRSLDIYRFGASDII